VYRLDLAWSNLNFDIIKVWPDTTSQRG